MKTRKEYDSIGGINVPNDRYWGASTQRSKKFFNIGKILVPPSIIRSIAIIKRSAAIVHRKERSIPQRVTKAIIKASDEVINGRKSCGGGTYLDIPFNEENTDYLEYLEWAKTNTIEEAD